MQMSRYQTTFSSDAIVVVVEWWRSRSYRPWMIKATKYTLGRRCFRFIYVRLRCLPNSVPNHDLNLLRIHQCPYSVPHMMILFSEWWIFFCFFWQKITWLWVTCLIVHSIFAAREVSETRSATQDPKLWSSKAQLQREVWDDFTSNDKLEHLLVDWTETYWMVICNDGFCSFLVNWYYYYSHLV